MDKNQFKEELSQILYLNRKKLLGALVGLIIGLLILIIGFFKTLLLCLMTIFGYYIGSNWNFEEDLKELIIKIIPERFK